jgi:hypothetical protein
VIRYRDLFKRIEQFPEEEVLSTVSINQLASELGPEGDFQVASAKLLYGTYERCVPLQQRIPAMETLRLWAEYLQAHLDISVPSLNQERLEQGMADRAEAAAQALWDEYQYYVIDPMKWTKEMVREENWRLFRELEIAGDAQHRLWLAQNAPALLPPPLKVPKLRATAPEFPFSPKQPRKAEEVVEQPKNGSASDSGYSSADNSDKTSSETSTDSQSSITSSVANSQSTDETGPTSEVPDSDVEGRLASLPVAVSGQSPGEEEDYLSESSYDALDSLVPLDVTTLKNERGLTTDTLVGPTCYRLS